MTTSEHGGKRKGAGRKPKFEKLVRITATLPPETVELLLKLGDGNISQGLRKLAELVKPEIE